ncbi:hypothetical protein NSA31_22595 [Bacillus subtilis]|uniref:hypothetical protein n=1 Tax=Bacillus subtilis TaxID=1423 RepID=UPI00214A24C5|nr:hypothetical protein [Bacillus subtilis]MCR1994531.1 hypothetical protein [Bacillus subtilis]
MDILNEITYLREREQSLNRKGYEQDAGRNKGAIFAYKPIGDKRHRFLSVNLHGWNLTIEEEESVIVSGEVVKRNKVIESRKLSDEDVVSLINSDDFTLQEMNRLMNRLKAFGIIND